MVSFQAIPSIVKRRAGWFIRDRFPFRPVVRQVQGVELVLPWSHRLPDYAAAGPGYGQNLVRLAAVLAEAGPLTVLDIGANVGDSAVQILHAADGKVLCVEADVAYLEFLHRNVDADERVDVVEALLAVGDAASARTAVRTGGTTRFADGVEAGSGDAMPTITPAELRERFPAFAGLRLVKSDTDGYDVNLVPAVAAEWADARPVLFFEYDPYLTRLAGFDPAQVWSDLESLGYRHVAVWDNGATPVGRAPIDRIAEHARALDDQPGRGRPRAYWDVAVVHGDDAAGRQAIEGMVSAELR